MTPTDGAPPASPPRAGLGDALDRLSTPRGLRRLARASAFAVFGVAILPVLLACFYAVAPPVSTLMLASWMRGETVDRRWIPLEKISSTLPMAVLASEDQRFCAHGGVDWRALLTVLDREGGPRRGASTLSMQTAKNLFLWPEQSWIRKGVEIPLALMIDALWSKDRMMEVYLNIAEWGPGIFGAEAAAQTYFGKSAARLSRREASLLAAALPNPYVRNADRPGPRMRRMASLIASRASRAKALAECLDLKTRKR